jgi:hypothetical protein
MSTADASMLSIVYRMLSDGSMVASTRPVPTARVRPEGIVRDSSRTIILAANAAAVVQDLGRRAGSETVIAHFGGDRYAMTARAFTASDLMEGADTLVLTMNSESALLTVLSVRGGRLLRTVRIDIPSRDVTRRDREEFVRQLRARTRDPRIRDAFLRVMTYPEKMPFVDALRWSYDRVVRLRRYVAPLDSTAQWLSLTPTGQLLSVIDIPAKARVLDFDRDRVLIVERDADDLEYLSLYKLIPSKR